MHYIIGRKYDKKKQHTVPERTPIGRLDATNPEMMYPNENFFKFFPNTPIPEAQKEPSRSPCLNVGTNIVIEKIVMEYELKSLLVKHFGDRTGLLLDFLSYLIITGKNTTQHYPGYAFNHALATEDARVLSDSTLSKFLSEVTAEQIQGFLDDWNLNRDHRSRIYVSYDSTNKNCQAGDLEMVEFGKAKVDLGTPVFGVGCAFDKTNKVPLFYERYPGSVNDVSQLEYFVKKMSHYKYRHVGFILDRGYFSKANIQYMDGQHFHFIMMVKGCKPLVSSIIDEYRGTFETCRDKSVRSHQLYCITTKRKLYPEDTKDRYFHLFYNVRKMADERCELEKEVADMQALLTKAVGQKFVLLPEHKKYFDIHMNKDGILLFVQEKKDVVQKELEQCGYFCIVTSESMKAQDAYFLYKGRDASEKLFCADKTFLGSKSMRVHSDASVETKLFIEFLALIVRNRLYNLLKDEMSRLGTKHNFMTVPSAIDKLEQIKMQRIGGEVYQQSYALTRHQKMILKAVGISPDEVKERIAQISSELAKVDAKIASQKPPQETAPEPIELTEEIIDATP
ncbi:MAG: transposase [Sutterellaceae bacterium]|nr:transposase [Sutterellaceae bacterium]